MTQTIEMLTRAAAGASTFDPEARTVEVIWSTGAAVKRYSWEHGDFMEELSMDPKAIRLDRFKAGMSLLDSHENFSMDSRLGTVLPDSVRIKGGQAFAVVKLSRNPKGEALFRDLSDGHPIQISVGYRIHKFEKTEGSNKSLPIFRAVDWEPLELSAVAIPADPGAYSRSVATPEGNDNMTDTATATITRAEKKRQNDIRALAKSSGLAADHELVSRAIDDDFSLDKFRAELLDTLIKREDEAPTFHVSQTFERNGKRTLSDAAADALMVRMDHRHKPETDAREFVGLTVPEIARRCIESRGETTHGLTPAALVTRALHSTSDFPAIMSNLAGKTLQAEFAQTPAALKAVSRQSSARDFKAKTRVKLSTAPELEKVTESGEYRRGTMFEDQESYRIDTFGKIFGITRQALINDDLGAFSSAASKMGQAAAVFEAKFLVALLESNPTMNDGKAVFHADHKNLLTGALLSEVELSKARLAFRKQTGLAGDLVNIAPRFLVVPPELETTAEKLLSDIAAAKTDDVNVVGRRLELLVEPRLTNATSWYLAADPAQVEGMEYSYLDGFEGPYLETRAGFDVDGVEIKVRLDFGAAFLEHRSWMKNPGPA